MAKRVSSGVTGFLAGLGDALRTLARLPASRAIATGFLMQSTVHGMLTVLLVVLATSTLALGAPGVGTLHAAMGAGGVIAAVFAMGLIGHQRLGPAWALALVGYGLPILFIGLVPTAIVAVVLLTVVGINNALLEVSGFTLLQRTVPDSTRAGVLGAVGGLIGLGYAVGGVLGSLLVERTDIRIALVVAGAILPIVALLLWSRASRLDDEYVIPEAKLDVLRGLPIFAPLSLAALEHVAAGLTETRHAAATNIIREGDPGEAFFVVIDGTAEVIERGQHQADLGPNASFGEVALIRGTPSPATVRATTDVTSLPPAECGLSLGRHGPPPHPDDGGAGDHGPLCPRLGLGRGRRRSRLATRWSARHVEPEATLPAVARFIVSSPRSRGWPSPVASTTPVGVRRCRLRIRGPRRATPCPCRSAQLAVRA